MESHICWWCCLSASLPELNSTCTAIFNHPRTFTAVCCCFWGRFNPEALWLDHCSFDFSAMEDVFWTWLHTRVYVIRVLWFILAMKAIQPNFRKCTAIDDAYCVISVKNILKINWKCWLVEKVNSILRLETWSDNTQLNRLKSLNCSDGRKQIVLQVRTEGMHNCINLLHFPN